MIVEAQIAQHAGKQSAGQSRCECLKHEGEQEEYRNGDECCGDLISKKTGYKLPQGDVCSTQETHAEVLRENRAGAEIAQQLQHQQKRQGKQHNSRKDQKKRQKFPPDQLPAGIGHGKKNFAGTAAGFLSPGLHGEHGYEHHEEQWKNGEILPERGIVPGGKIVNVQKPHR